MGSRAGTAGHSAQKSTVRLLYLLLAILSTLSALASPADALKHYQSGKYDAALKEYDRLRLQRPEDARLAFNAGAAAYQARQFEEATRHFSGATGAHDPKLAQSAFYNLGNAYFQMGDAAPEPAQKQQAWESSLGFYDTALKLNSADPDAKHNHDFVQRKLEELKQQQDRQQSKDNQDQKQDDKNPTAPSRTTRKSSRTSPSQISTATRNSPTKSSRKSRTRKRATKSRASKASRLTRTPPKPPRSAR